MTKSDRIRYLMAKGYATRVIAEIVGCRPEYVRTAGRQRKNGPSKADRTYLLKRYKSKTLKEAWQKRSAENYSDPAYYERHKTYQAQSYRRKRDADAGSNGEPSTKDASAQ